MVEALAGRRIDAADSKESRFPLANVEAVRVRIREMFERERVVAMVSSAACGADLIALEEAGRMGLRRRVVLPFARDQFRESSVTDRPGDWGPLYDRLLDEVEAKGDLVTRDCGSDDEAYALANSAILDEASRIAEELNDHAFAALVWDGASRGPGDLTQSFGTEARRRGLKVLELLTV